MPRVCSPANKWNHYVKKYMPPLRNTANIRIQTSLADSPNYSSDCQHYGVSAWNALSTYSSSNSSATRPLIRSSWRCWKHQAPPPHKMYSYAPGSTLRCGVALIKTVAKCKGLIGWNKAEQSCVNKSAEFECTKTYFLPKIAWFIMTYRWVSARKT